MATNKQIDTLIEQFKQGLVLNYYIDGEMLSEYATLWSMQIGFYPAIQSPVFTKTVENAIIDNEITTHKFTYFVEPILSSINLSIDNITDDATEHITGVLLLDDNYHSEYGCYTLNHDFLSTIVDMLLTEDWHITSATWGFLRPTFKTKPEPLDVLNDLRANLRAEAITDTEDISSQRTQVLKYSSNCPNPDCTGNIFNIRTTIKPTMLHGTIYNEYKCKSCGAKWTNRYEYVDSEILYLPPKNDVSRTAKIKAIKQYLQETSIEIQCHDTIRSNNDVFYMYLKTEWGEDNFHTPEDIWRIYRFLNEPDNTPRPEGLIFRYNDIQPNKALDGIYRIERADHGNPILEELWEATDDELVDIFNNLTFGSNIYSRSPYNPLDTTKSKTIEEISSNIFDLAKSINAII